MAHYKEGVCEEVFKSPANGDDSWRGIHSGRVFKSSEVEKVGPNCYFGKSENSWNEFMGEDKQGGK